MCEIGYNFKNIYPNYIKLHQKSDIKIGSQDEILFHTLFIQGGPFEILEQWRTIENNRNYRTT